MASEAMDKRLSMSCIRPTTQHAHCSFSFVKLLGSTTASSYVKSLAEEADLCVMPSELFVDAGDKSLRICFGRRGTTDMIERWRAVVEK